LVIKGAFTLANGVTYSYDFGALGVGRTRDMSAAEIQAFMDSVLFTNQYITCFSRFGFFFGVGLVLLGTSFIKWNIVSRWLGWLR
jgi:hypothetical protein